MPRKKNPTTPQAPIKVPRRSLRRQHSPGTSNNKEADEEVEDKDKEKDKVWGLPIQTQRRLLEDIECAGGLFDLDLCEFCEGREKDYGWPGSPLRRRVQNKVDRWKKKTSVEFEKVRKKLLNNKKAVSPVEETVETRDIVAPPTRPPLYSPLARPSPLNRDNTLVGLIRRPPSEVTSNMSFPKGHCKWKN